MSTIDRKVVEMQFDNAQFEKNVKGSMSTLEKLKSALNFNGLAKGFDDIDRQSKKVTFSEMNNGVQVVTKSFNLLEEMAIGAIRKIGSMAAEEGLKIVKSLSVEQIASGWDKYGEKTKSVGTLIAQGYDMSEVEKELGKLNWYTDETSAEFTEMVTSIAKFTAAGKTLPEATTALMGISNWAYLSGQNAQTASRAMYQLSQAMSKGVFRLDDYKSIQNASMDTVEFRQRALDAAVALGTLEKQADGSYKSLVKGASKGTFTIGQFTESLTKGAWFTSDVMMKVYGEYGAAIDFIYEKFNETGKTASQVIEEFSDEIHDKLGDELGDFAIKAFKAAQEARTWGDAVDSVKEALATQWSGIYEAIFGNYEEAKDLFTDLAETFYDSFVPPIDNIKTKLNEGLKGIDPFKEGYLAENYGIPEDVYRDWMRLGETVGFTSGQVQEFLNLHTDLDGESKTVLSHWLQLHSEAGQAQSEFIGMSKQTFAETSASILGITNEQATALKATADEYGSNSYKFRSELKKVFGDGKLGMMELATSLYGVGDGIDNITTKDLSSYLKNSIKLTDEQITELYKLSDQYGGTSKQVDDYLKSLSNLEGYGMANKSWTRKGIEDLLELSDAFRKAEKAQQDYQKGDIVAYIQAITGANKEQVESLWELYNAEAETEAQAERNKKKMDELVKSISKGDEATGELVLSIMEMEKETDAMLGRQNLIDAFNTAWEGLSEILGTIKQAFADLFGVIDSKGIYSFTQRLKDMASKLKLSNDQLEKLRKTFRGVFSIFKMVGQFVDAALIPIRTLFNLITGGKKSILDITSSWGDFLYNLAQTNAVGKAVTPFFEKISEKIKVVYPIIENFIKKIKGIKEAITNTFNDNGGGLSGAFAVIKEGLKSVIEVALDLIGAFTGWDVSEVKEKVLEFLDTMWNRVKNILPDQEKLEEAFNNIKDAAKKALEFLGLGGGDTVKEEAKEGEKGVDIVSKSVEMLSTAFEKLAGFVNSAKDGIGGFFKHITTFAEAFKGSKTGKSIIEFFGGLTDGLSSLSLLDIVDISALIGGLLLVRDIFWTINGIIKNLPFHGMKIAFTTFADGFKQMAIGIKRVSTGINFALFAAGLLIIISALGKLMELDFDKVGTGLGILTVVILEMVGVMELMSHTTKKSKGGNDILKFAISLFAIVKVIEILVGISKESPDQLWQAVAVIAIVEIVMGMTSWLSSQGNIATKIAGAIAMAIMVQAIKGVVEQVVILAKAGNEGDILTAGVVIALLTGVMGTIVGLFGVVGGFGGAGAVAGMLAGAASMNIMVGAIKGIAEALMPLLDSDASPEKIKAVGDVLALIAGILGGILIAIALIVGICVAIGRKGTEVKNSVSNVAKVVDMANGNKIKAKANIKVGKGLEWLALGASLVMVAGAMWIVAQAIEDMVAAAQEGDIVKASIILGAFFVGIGALIILFGKIKMDTGKVLAGAGAMMIISLSLAVIAETIAKLTVIGSFDKAALVVAGVVLAILAGAIGGLVMLFSLAEGSASSMIAGAGAFAIMASSLSGLAVAIGILTLIGKNDVGALISAGLVIGGLVGIMGLILALFGKVGNGAAMVAGAGSFALLAIGIDLLCGSLIILAIGINMLGSALDNNAGKIAKGFHDILEGISGILNQAVGVLGDFLIAIFYKLAEVIVQIHDPVVTVITEIVAIMCEALLASADKILDTILTLLLNSLTALDKALPQIVTLAVNLLLNVFSQLAAHTEEFVVIVLDFFIGVINGVAARLGEFMEAIANLVGALADGINRMLSSMNVEGLDGILESIYSLAQIFLALGLLALLTAPAMLGLTGLLSVAALFMVGMTLLGGIMSIPGVADLMSQGIGLADTLSAVIAKLCGAFLQLTAMTVLAPIVMVGASAILIAVTELAAVFWAIGGIATIPSVMENITTAGELATALTNAVGNFVGAFEIVSYMGVLAPLAIVGSLALTEVFTVLTATLVTVGALMELIPNAEEFVSKGATVLAQVGEALGNFVGKFIGGAISSIAATLPEVGTNLSTFMTNVQGFVDGAKNIGGDVTSGLSNLFSAVLYLAGAEIISSITDFLGLGDIWKTLGTRLSSLGDALVDFNDKIKDVKTVKMNSAIDAIESVVGIAKSLNENQSLFDRIFKKDNFSKFCESLSSFATGIKDFGEKANDVSKYTGAMKRVAAAIDPVVTIAKDLTNNETVIDKLAPKSGLEKFGTALAEFAKGIAAYGEEAEKSKDYTNSMKAVAKAIEPTVDLAIKIMQSEDAIDKLSEKTGLQRFGESLDEFATGISTYGKTAMTMVLFFGPMKAAAEAIEPVVDLAIKLNDNETVIDDIGKNETALSKFGASLTTFATGMVDFGAAAIKVMAFQNAISASLQVLDPVFQFAEKLDANKKWWEMFQDKTAFGKFGESLTEVAKGLKDFGINTLGINIESAENAVAMVEELAQVAAIVEDGTAIATLFENLVIVSADFSTFANKMSDAGLVKKLESAKETVTKIAELAESIPNSDKFVALSTALTSVSSEGIAAFTKSFSDAQPDAKSAMEGFIGAAIEGIESKTQELSISLSNTITNAIDTIKEQKKQTFKTLGSDLADSLTDGFEAKQSDINTSLSDVVEAGRKAISDFFLDFKKVGERLMQGFINGLESYEGRVKAVASSIASAAVNALNVTLDINSPSKVAFGIGSYFGEGFVNGVSEFVDAADETASELGNSAVDGIRNAINEASSMVMDTNADVTIRPVLDLSEIQNGVGQIDGLMSRFNGYSVNGTASLASRVAVGSGKASAFDEQSEMSKLTDSIKDLISNQGSTQNNTFNINGTSDPEEVAERVAQILAQQIKRRDALWA